MPTAHSQVGSRTSVRRQVVIDEALVHAKQLLDEQGAGAVSMSEVARRLGMRAPSLYKYFPSLNAIYDALFAQGYRISLMAIQEAVEGLEPGLERLLTACRAMMRASFEERGLASLMYWRPLTGFEPSPSSYEPSVAIRRLVRADLAAAVRRRELAKAADSDDALRLLSILIAGIYSQQAANEPDAPFDKGAFTSLSETTFQMFVQHYAPRSRKAKP
jgi:AcrR family transcriptional regulator